MKYLCLRNCWVDTRLWKEGRVYDLPDAMEKYPKNFRLMRHQDAPKGAATCPSCGKVCLSEFGLKSHARVHLPKVKKQEAKPKEAKKQSKKKTPAKAKA